MKRDFHAALLILLLSGCSMQKAPEPLATAASADEIYTLNILEEVNDGKHLYVTADVKLKEAIEKARSVLRLRAMANGATVGESFAPLTPENADASDAARYTVKISVDAASFTDYQMDLLWGQDAVSYVDSLPRDKTVLVSDVTMVKTGQKKPVITGKFQNKGLSTVSKLVALVQFAWVPDGSHLDLSSLKAENDTEIEVPGISIDPGASRDFSIELETDIPSTKGGVYTPIVRIKDEPGKPEPARTDPPESPEE